MPWVKLDDDFAEHPKIARLSDSALALFVVGLAYCNRNLTDGFIPKQVGLGQLRWCDGNAASAIQELEEAGIWDEAPGGWMVHDYLIYQPSKEAVLAEREQKREAGRLGGLASAQAAARKRLEQAKGQAGAQPPAQAPTTAPAQADAQAEPQAESNPVPVPQPVPESKASREEESSQRQKRTEIRGNGLPVEKERLVLNLIAAIRKPLEQEEADSLRKYAGALPESALVKAIESVKRKNAADPLKYAFGVLISEKRELAERSTA